MKNYKVIILMDQNCEEYLFKLCEENHCWVNESDQNMKSIDNIIDNTDDAFSNEYTLNTFVIDSENISNELGKLLETIMDHHNAYTDYPGVNIIEIFGLNLDDSIKELFLEFGFSKFKVTNSGFEVFGERKDLYED